MTEILKMIAITFIPTLELRASIPYGIFIADLPWFSVFIIALITNIILGFIIFYLIEWIIFVITKIKPVNYFWQKYVARTQRRIHSGVQKYGEWAVMVFIGIPLPGSGVYTGALAAFLIGLSPRKFIIANVFGVIIAAVLVTLICMTGAGISSIFIKQVN